jgi:hypothetical protein
VFVSHGRAYANFRRALDTRNLTISRAAAAEIPQVPLDDALRICLLLRNAEPVAYDRAVLRWLARFAREKAFSLGQLKVAIAAFEGLAENPARSERQLRGLLDRPG